MIFLLEALLKLYVYRTAYFKSTWNRFDFFVVVSSLADFAIELALITTADGEGAEQSEVLTVGP